jgi:hypothetical protein
LISRLALRLVAESEFLYIEVREDIEGLTVAAFDMIVVLGAELGKERLVGDAAHRVIQAHVRLGVCYRFG